MYLMHVHDKLQSDRNSNAWVTKFPKEHSSLNAGQFPVVCQTYFEVPQTCLEELEGQPILQKSGRRGRRSKEIACDAYGENLVKATLPGGGWTYQGDTRPRCPTVVMLQCTYNAAARITSSVRARDS